MNQNMRKSRTILTALLLNIQFVLFCMLPYPLQKGTGGAAHAQEISILVTPVQDILPPQVGLYIENPQKYFNVALVNNTAEDQNVFMGLRIDQLSPQQELKLLTTARHMPQTPLVVRAHETKQLTMVEQKNMFRYLPLNEVYISDGMYSNYERGIFGLMPEGTYTLNLTAYRWQPTMTTPQVLSSPNTGKCTFRVCYNIQAPQWLQPMTGIGGFDLGVATLQKMTPMFSWTASVLACNPIATQFRYDFKLVEMLPGQSPDQAMDRNAALYERTGLLNTTLTLPANYVNKLNEGTTYIAQVKSRPVSTTNLQEGSLNYISMENDGKSTLLMFQLGKDPFADDEDNGEETKDDKEDDTKTPTASGGWSANADIDEDNDSLYVFSMPALVDPVFVGARKLFEDDNLVVSWQRAWYEGGRGERQDTIDFNYHVMLFKANPRDSWETTFKQKPIAQKTTKELKTVFTYDDLTGLMAQGDYIVMRVKPECTNEKSIRFLPDSANVTDFAYTSRFSKVAQCNSTITVSNKNSIKSLKANDVVAIGEYNLKIKTAKLNNNKRSFSGTGEIEWNPVGMKIMVQVKFDSLYVNTDKQVYSGLAYTYNGNENGDVSSVDAVDQLFSDWGVNQFMTDIYLPGEVRSAVTKGAKDVAQTLELNKYYNYIKTAKTIWTDGRNKTINNCQLPLKLPKSINPTPVDLQIASMKFKWNSAEMNIIGEFKIPKSKATDDLLILGAPRLCMSPDKVLPETGFVCLLGDFKVKDPDSQFSMSFNAPTDLDNPVNGCFVSWQEDKFQRFHADIDIRVPHLKRVANDQALDEPPAFNFQTDIESWDAWIAKGNIPEFEVEDLPGWRFKAGGSIVYDHKVKENDPSMKNFKWPENFNYEEAGITKGNLNPWQGLYIEDVSVTFPGAIYVDDAEDHKFSLSFKNMLVDRSGATFTAQASKLVQGSLCGWGFELEKAWMDVLQNDFSKCGFNGNISVPLISSKFKYDCSIYNQRVSGKGDGKSGFAYVFKTQMGDSINTEFDWILAQTTLYRDQTYFLLEAIDQADGTTKTDLELCMGGKIGIGALKGASKKLEELTSKLPLKLRIPDIHFSGMRLSNTDVGWKSIYARSMQTRRDESEAAKQKELSKYLTLYEIEDKQVVFGEGSGDKIYFNRGKWSLASFSKEIGPFKFSVEDFDFNLSGKELKLTIDGRIGLLDTLICADAKVSIYAEAKNIDNIKKFSVGYKDTEFEEISLDCDFAGIGLKGNLKMPNQHWGARLTGVKDNGYEGHIELKLKSLFTADVNGGFYDHSGDDGNYSWGFFNVGLDMAHGIPIPPIQLKGISGGFYFNCYRNVKDPTTAIPKKDLIGVNAGLSIASEDGGLLKGDFDLTVVFDHNKSRLTTFMLNGNLKGVGGLIDSQASIIYEDNEQDNYFNINVTVDAKVSPSGLAEAITEYAADLTGLQAEMELIKGEAIELVNNATGGLANAIGANEKQADKSEAKTGDTSNNSHLEMGASASLDFRVTKRENGKNLSSVKWHLYLGMPERSKRCQFTLIDFKSKIVSVRIGADAYLCLGNELPDNGKLPDIPEKIREHLDGSTKGSGVQSGNMAEAERARKEASRSFEASATDPKFGGGVMFGASAYGYINVDLGLIYGNLGAEAGFDVCVGKLASTFCQNAKGKQMGYNGWYGRGQLYAYLEAKFGIRIYLGFWNGKIDILDAAIGGVLECGLPNPSWFKGSVRCKLHLMNGLVKINRKFSFECGTVCEPFQGNALDDFDLFGTCSLGYEHANEGWSDENLVQDSRVNNVHFLTNAPLHEHFRVLDKNHLEHLKKDWEGDPEKLEMQSKKTFVFLMSNDSRDQNGNVRGSNEMTGMLNVIDPTYVKNGNYLLDSVTINPKAIRQNWMLKLHKDNEQGTYHLLERGGNSNWALGSNTYYIIQVNGSAKEVVKGRYQDPEYVDLQTGQYYAEKKWVQHKLFFFRTGDFIKEIPDVLDLQEHVALAYPSNRGSLVNVENIEGGGFKCNDGMVDAYVCDIERPMLALKDLDAVKAYKKGHLYWQLDGRGNPGGNVQEIVNIFYDPTIDHLYNVNYSGNCVNMTLPPNKKFNVKAGNRYRLKLVYRINANYMNDDGTTRHEEGEETLVDLGLIAREGNWQTGFLGSNNQRQRTVYDRPFIGLRLDEMKYNYTSASGDTQKMHQVSNENFIYDREMVNGVSMRKADPYLYISYLSRWAFIGGFPLKSYKFDDLEVPVSESAIYTGRINKFTGNPYGCSGAYTNHIVKANSNMWEDWSLIRNLTIYDKSQWKDFGRIGTTNRYNDYYPLPSISDDAYIYTEQVGVDMTPEYVPSETPGDIYSMGNLLRQIAAPYSLCANAVTKIKSTIKSIDGKSDSDVRAFNNANRGAYLTISDNLNQHNSIEIPYYQFPLIYGGTWNNSSGNGHSIQAVIGKGEVGARQHESASEVVYYRWVDRKGNNRNFSNSAQTDYTNVYTDDGRVRLDNFDSVTASQNITEITTTAYRVNTYDVVQGLYGVNTGMDANAKKTFTLKNPFNMNTWVKFILNK